jgi:hypothetical protein
MHLRARQSRAGPPDPGKRERTAAGNGDALEGLQNGDGKEANSERSIAQSKKSVTTFSVKDFDKFQHYKDRTPPWIKLYNALLDDYAFARLQDASKAHLIAIWLVASRHDNKIPYDAEWIGSRINATEPVDLGALIEVGFIELNQPLRSTAQDASGAIAERAQTARPEREGETEGETDSVLRTAPVGAPLRPIDLNRSLWDTGKSFLIANGIAEHRAGSIIGRWRRDHGEAAVIEALARADAAAPSNVVEFIEGCLKNGKSKLTPATSLAVGADLAVEYREAQRQSHRQSDHGVDDALLPRE